MMTVTAKSNKLPELDTLLAKHRPLSRSEKQKILTTFKQAPTEELGQLLSEIEVHRLFQKMGDHHLDRASKLELLQTLCHDRVGDISVENRVRLVDGLQFGRTDSDDEAGILDVFVATHGADLTRLKNGIDAGGDYHDLQELVFHDIDRVEVRAQILEHIATEAKTAGNQEVKALSDIDDTFYANWMDQSYPSKTIYPGVLEFYQELDLGPGRSGRVGDKVFVTARPGERTGTIKNEILESVSRRGVPDATVLAGDISHFVGSDRIAEMKLKNFQQYRQLYPEYPFVWTGDSGQGDVQFAQAMLSAPGGNLKGAFIHDVVLDGKPKTAPEQREEYRRQGIVFFDTYVGAALEACQQGLISKEGVGRVAQGAVKAFDNVRFDSPAQKEARKGELAADLERVSRLEAG